MRSKKLQPNEFFPNDLFEDVHNPTTTLIKYSNQKESALITNLQMKSDSVDN